jgi:hypothetical protein
VSVIGAGGVVAFGQDFYLEGNYVVSRESNLVSEDPRWYSAVHSKMNRLNRLSSPFKVCWNVT